MAQAVTGSTPTLAGLTRRASRLLAMSVMLGGAAAVLLIAQMGILARIVTDLAFRHHSFAQEYRLAAFLLAAVAARALFQGAADTASDRAALNVTSSLRQEVLAHLFRVGPVGLVGQDSGRIATVLSEGIEALQPYLARYIPRAAAMVVLPLLILAVVFHLDKISFLTLAITGPLIPVFMALVGYGAQAIMHRKWKELLLLGSSFLDMLQGLTTLRLFGEAGRGAELVGRLAEAHRSSTMSVMRVAFLTTAVLEFFSSLSIAAVAVFFGARLIRASVPFETAFFVLLLAPEYFMPLRAFSASYHARQNATSAFQPLLALMALPELRASAGPTETPSPYADAPPPPLLVSVEMRDICAGYTVVKDGEAEEGPNVLENVSATFPANALTVLTGASGGGKTTIFRLLLGMMPPRSGTLCGLLVNDQTAPLSTLTVGWVPQAPFLLADTIAANLRLAAPDAPEEELVHAAREAGALAFIEALPQGFDTVLGERGAPLSAGQIRRLALARALLRRPQILLFDEPTADLDEESARVVCNAIGKAVEGRVAVAISHRDDVLRLASQVLRLSQGRLYLEKEAPEEQSTEDESAKKKDSGKISGKEREGQS